MSTNRKQLHERLWAAAEQLRANSSLKLNEMSEPILGLIFLKFADVKFRRAKAEIEKEREKLTGRKPPLTPDHYKQRGVPFIVDEAGYAHLMNMPEGENIGKAINDAMKSIEQKNRELAGILPQDYTTLSNRPAENSRILLQLLKNFNQIPDDIEGDAFGEIYEYFLGEFARAEGQKGGEFFTPPSIVKLLVEIIEPYHGKIFDPACGSGGMFVQSANFVARHQKNKRPIMEEVGIYGQEKGANNMRIAKMNLAIHGPSGKIENENSFYVDAHKSIGQFDYVLANPPFNVKGKDKNKQIVIDPARLQGDKRFNYGLPLTGKKEISNANYLWLQMFASALNDKGRAGFVMANSASDAGNKEKEIRAKMVDAGFVDVIVSVGSNMFMNAPLSCTLWFFDKRKLTTGRKNNILFINAQDIFTKVDRAHNEWSENQIEEIANIVRRYRGEEGFAKYEDIKGRCKVVEMGEIIENDYSLNPFEYIQFPNLSNKEFQIGNELNELSNFLLQQTEVILEHNKNISSSLSKYYPQFKWSDYIFSTPQILEQLMQLIYIEWFLKLNFPGAEKLEMVDSESEYEKIPKGWCVKKLGEIINVKKGKNITEETAQPGNIPVVAGGLGPAYFNNKANTKNPVITVSASGANAGYTNVYFQNIWASDCSFIDMSVTKHVYYYYLFLKNKQDEISRMQRGSAQPHVYPKHIMKLKILDFPEHIIEQFEGLIKPMVELLTEFNKPTTTSSKNSE